VGWFLPLLGISQVGFLVVDALIAAEGAQLGEERLRWLPAYLPNEVHRLVGARTYTRDAEGDTGRKEGPRCDSCTPPTGSSA